MNKQKTIRHKLLIAVIVLAAVIGVLGYSSFRGTYAYRDLTIILSQRASEFPVAADLARAVDDLQNRFDRMTQAASDGSHSSLLQGIDLFVEHRRFRSQQQVVKDYLNRYRLRLGSDASHDPLLWDRSKEQEMVRKIDELLKRVSDRNRSDVLMLSPEQTELQRQDLLMMSELSRGIPNLLYERMASVRDEVRTRYRTWIAISWSSLLFTAILLVGLCIYVRRAVILPFKALLHGSRLVAAGRFDYRIEIDSQDELSELAAAINMGTESFLRIQRSLNDQVRERSREVIRNEQLASVGFLAAGVAHEINNPLASIAWSAEALESRLHNLLHSNASASESNHPNDTEVLRTYLRRIQDEAFRCKGITERLLDFSRMSQAQKKKPVDLSELIQDVVEMVQHLGQYRNRKIAFEAVPNAMVWASPQEIKQVVLNLITNSLDSLPEDSSLGLVQIEVANERDMMRMTIRDNGCGMSDEVKLHLFEPFFTRRRDGRGTGLGLPITSRIIADHGGRILAHSDGIGRGSRFDVLLPTQETAEQNDRQLQAA